MKPGHQHFRLGRVLTLLVVLGFTADMILRMLPFEMWRLNAHPVLVQLRQRSGAFEPAAKYEWDRIGDIARLANLPPIEPRRVTTFETDLWGFRNPPGFASGGDVDAILVGDSFAYGGDSYDDTLAAIISKKCGLRVYNAAPHPLNDFGRIPGIAQQLGMTHGVVIYELLERGGAPAVPENNPPVLVPGPRFLVRHSLTWLIPLDRRLRIAATFSPAEVFSQRLYKRLENSVILPNAHADSGFVTRLANGEPIYFIEPDVHPVSSPVQNWADYIKWMASLLREQNLDLIVVLVPNKYTVYGPLVAGHVAAGESESSYLDSLARELESQRIVTVNLRKPLQAVAAERLKHNSYIFWLDDTHWNSDGKKVAAERICEQFRSVRRSW